VEYNWSTFFLEIFNFLVLVWILQHFLYRPVLKVIAERRAKIEKTLADARSIEDQAQALKVQYESRQAEWQNEKEAARARLAEEIGVERGRLMAALEASLAEQREKARVLEERKREEWQRTTEEMAIANGAVFAARLLARLARPDLEAMLIDAVLEDLRRLPADSARALATAADGASPAAKVTSAFPLDPARREKLGELLSALTAAKLHVEFNEDRELLAGVRVNVGSWMLHANLRDELRFFSESAQRAA